MVTHNFNKLLPFLFNMDTLVSDQNSPMTYTNRFCVAMFAVFDTYNPSEAALTVLRWTVLLRQWKIPHSCPLHNIMKFNVVKRMQLTAKGTG